MSTFDGIVEEFPSIRIDFFRNHPGKKPPAACFLSHIHSDHLLGLESLRMPFVYCSSATRRLLLKMEKYPHRINFSKGVLEARKQTYKHLKHILRPLPLQTPVNIELDPKSRIQVTLFDANHCPGAVMFLIEGDGRAVLYTGDVRAEPWWVNSIARSPVLLPFASKFKRLDCIYLDTTFASHSDIHREFPTKAEGLAELTKKVTKCSSDSIFYFRAWTLGYEDVWITLSSLLGSQVHCDPYQLRLFQAITDDGLLAEPGPALIGFRVGNAEQSGCLTAESNTKIHSCEPGLPCHTTLKKDKQNIVWITPIISRLQDGTEIAEVGAGGGGGDLYQQSREVDLGSDAVIDALRLLCTHMVTETNREYISRVEAAITRAQHCQDHRILLDDLDILPEAGISIKEFLNLLSGRNSERQPQSGPGEPKANTIHFPYSRHSSYTELRHLVEVFRPKDICPCTVDLESWNHETVSMRSLFGDLCSEKTFKYDQIIKDELERRNKNSATSLTGHDEEESQRKLDSQSTETETDLGEESQGDVFVSVEEGATSGPHQVKTAKDRFRDAWRAANNGSDTFVPFPLKQVVSDGVESYNDDYLIASDRESGMGQEDSGSDYLADIPEQISAGHISHGSDGIAGDNVLPRSLIDHIRRQEAFYAAKSCLEEGDDIHWRSMHIRSLGWEGHTREEMEL